MTILTNYSETTLPTRAGSFRTLVYRDEAGLETVALVSGAVREQPHVAVRVHSACFTSEVLGSLKCDCREQLEFSMNYIAAHGGVLIYLNQEGRGIGLSNKIRAYALQESGVDTVDANLLLGLPLDARTYEAAADVLRDLGVSSIWLMTNNPQKIGALEQLGIPVVGRVPIEIKGNPHSQAYLDTKRLRMGHLFKDTASPADWARDRPYVHINFALDHKGRAGSGQISCERDWQRVHELRERYTGIGVGAVTWIKERPRLTAREEQLKRRPHRQPNRVIFAGGHECDVGEDGRRTFLIGTRRPTAANVIHLPAERRQLDEPLRLLFQQGVDSMLVEGGPTLVASFMRQKMADMLTVYVRTQSEHSAMCAAAGLIGENQGEQSVVRFGEGVLISRVLANRPAPAALSGSRER